MSAGIGSFVKSLVICVAAVILVCGNASAAEKTAPKTFGDIMDGTWTGKAFFAEGKAAKDKTPRKGPIPIAEYDRPIEMKFDNQAQFISGITVVGQPAATCKISKFDIATRKIVMDVTYKVGGTSSYSITYTGAFSQDWKKIEGTFDNIMGKGPFYLEKAAKETPLLGAENKPGDKGAKVDDKSAKPPVDDKAPKPAVEEKTPKPAAEKPPAAEDAAQPKEAPQPEWLTKNADALANTLKLMSKHQFRAVLDEIEVVRRDTEDKDFIAGLDALAAVAGSGDKMLDAIITSPATGKALKAQLTLTGMKTRSFNITSADKNNIGVADGSGFQTSLAWEKVSNEEFYKMADEVMGTSVDELVDRVHFAAASNMTGAAQLLVTKIKKLDEAKAAAASAFINLFSPKQK